VTTGRHDVIWLALVFVALAAFGALGGVDLPPAQGVALPELPALLGGF
jgi:predicted small lipoprotein YifL